LIPLFGTLWGVVFLDEALSWRSIIGMAVILLGTSLVTQFNPATFLTIKK
jgi:drug/metabolite transporter (DMT)-like permease